MDERLLKLYRAHASSEEAIAILFVKKNLDQAKGCWVDITDYQRYEMSSDDLHFRYVIGGLYRRKIQPQYPPKSEYINNEEFDERQYYLMIRAITWETAQRDIRLQKSKKIKAKKFKITGVSYDKNRNNKNFFRDDAPPEIKALAKDLLNRTNPLWDDALKYAIEPEFVYKIKQIRVI
ncbi:MAG: hypothetical protein ACI9SP_004364 [Arenicella sp.]|jgi:hypothetical protein